MFRKAKRPAALPVNLRVPPIVARREDMMLPLGRGDALGCRVGTLLCGLSGGGLEVVMVSFLFSFFLLLTLFALWLTFDFEKS